MNFVNSSVLEYENSRNPLTLQRQAMERFLQMAVVKQMLNPSIRVRTEQLEQLGLKAMDALHVACAEGLIATILSPVISD